MKKEIIYYYTAPGERNTNNTLKTVREWAQKYNIKRVLVPSKSGQTAQKAHNLFKNTDIQLTIVGTDPNIFSSEILAQLKSNGTRVVFYKDIPYNYPPDMNTAYRRMGEGFKVAVELGIIAAYLEEGDTSDVISLGGTKKGVDTALVIRPAKSEAFDQLEVREIIAKPRSIKIV
jgi:uncharacterized protein